MSGVTALGVLAAASVASAGYAVYSGEQAKGDRKDAMNEARRNQAKAEASADMERNRLNPKKANAAGVMSGIEQAAKGGASGTMLTGPSGVDASALQLGKSTLLGA
jgi:uncharacterized protein HemX